MPKLNLSTGVVKDEADLTAGKHSDIFQFKISTTKVSFRARLPPVRPISDACSSLSKSFVDILPKLLSSCLNTTDSKLRELRSRDSKFRSSFAITSRVQVPSNTVDHLDAFPFIYIDSD